MRYVTVITVIRYVTVITFIRYVVTITYLMKVITVTYLMMVIPETSRVYYIRYLRFYSYEIYCAYRSTSTRIFINEIY
jgi:hypothetical protein